MWLLTVSTPLRLIEEEEEEEVSSSPRCPNCLACFFLHPTLRASTALSMDAPKPGAGDMHDQAPEVSLRGHQDDGPILATAYTTNSFDHNPSYQHQQDKPHTGFTPIQQHHFLPQYAQSMQHPTPPSLPASAERQQQQQEQVDPPTPPQAKRKGKWIWPLALVIAILAALAAGIGIGYAVGDNKSTSSHQANSTDGSR